MAIGQLAAPTADENNTQRRPPRPPPRASTVLLAPAGAQGPEPGHRPVLSKRHALAAGRPRRVAVCAAQGPRHGLERGVVLRALHGGHGLAGPAGREPWAQGLQVHGVALRVVHGAVAPAPNVQAVVPDEGGVVAQAVGHDRLACGRAALDSGGRGRTHPGMHWKRGRYPPPTPPGRPAYAQPLSP